MNLEILGIEISSEMMNIFLNYKFSYRPPTKLREGNAFTGVCLSTGGVGYPWYQVLSGGSIQGDRSSAGIRAVGHPGGVYPTPPPPEWNARYASYWNAFLLGFCFKVNKGTHPTFSLNVFQNLCK